MSQPLNELLRQPVALPNVAANGAASLPRREDIATWTAPIRTLQSSADKYRSEATRLESIADSYVRHLSHPGGSPWLGDAADAAHDLAYADRRVVYQAADNLRDAAKIACRGAQELSHARGLALEAIADAEADEFAVGNDLSVTDTRRYTTREIAQYTARQTVAETHQSYIALRAGALASADAEIGARLHASAEEFRSLVPLDWTKTTDGSNDTSVQALDHGRHPQSPASDSPLSIQNAEDVHRVVDPLPPGRHPGVKTLPTPEAIAALYAQLTENSVPGPPSTYPGQWRLLEDGTKIGFRPTSKFGGPTVEIWYPDGKKTDVHLAEPPKPPAPEPAPAPVPVTVPEPAPIPLPVTLPAPDLGTRPALTPEDGGVLGILGAFGIGIVVGIGELGKLIFSP